MAAHRYWRIYVSANNGFAGTVSISEIELRSSLGGSDLTLLGGGGTASASQVSGGNIPSYGQNNAFDNNTATFWSADSGVTGQWIAWDFGAGNAYDIQQVAITNGSGPNPACFIKDGLVQYSDDGSVWAPYFLISGNSTALGTTLFDYVALPSANVAITGPLPGLTGFTGGLFSISQPVSLVKVGGGAGVALTTPTPRIAFSTGAAAALASPSPIAYSVGHDSTGENDFTYTAPSPLLTITAGGNAAITGPRAALAIAATGTNFGTSAIIAPSPMLSAAGTVSAVAQADIRAPSANLVGYGGAVCSITLSGGHTVQATGTTGLVGGAAITCPMFELTASVTAQNHASVDILAPSPRMGGTLQAWLVAPMATLTAIGSAVITATYEAYAINLLQPLDSNPSNNYEAKAPQATHYTNFPFTHVVRYQNSYYGANSTGLYLLEGTTDDGAPIPWAFETAMTDFNTPNKKTVASAYFSGRFGPASTIRLIEGEKMPNTYSFTTPRGTLAQNHRQKFGKGTKGRYYALSASGTGECELDGIEPEVHQLTRRI